MVVRYVASSAVLRRVPRIVGYQNRILGIETRDKMEPTFSACHGIGLIDASAPIIVGERHIANWLIGQSNPMEVT